MSQIRITKNEELEQALELMKSYYPLLSEADLIKVALGNEVKRLLNKENDNNEPDTEINTLIIEERIEE